MSTCALAYLIRPHVPCPILQMIVTLSAGRQMGKAVRGVAPCLTALVGHVNRPTDNEGDRKSGSGLNTTRTEQSAKLGSVSFDTLFL